MLVVHVEGGLGNQMFQYAFGITLAEKLGVPLILDCSFYKNHNGSSLASKRNFELDIFNLNIRTLESEGFLVKFFAFSIKLLRRIIGANCFDKYFNNFYLIEDRLKDSSFTDYTKSYSIFKGYWQNERYFSHNRDNILKMFRFKIESQVENLEVAQRIQNCNSVSIHVRRGDYVLNSSTKQSHGTCTLNYYYSAIDYLAKQVSNPIFFIFSDDLDWVKVNFELNYPHEFVEVRMHVCENVDMLLMSKCKHNIIANSSYSWWAAWLNSQDNKIVIAPKNWFADINLNLRFSEIVPSEWIKL